MKMITVKNNEELASLACSFVVDKINRIEAPVLGLATGSTPIKLYAKLVEKYKQKKLSFQKATTFNLDEYIGLPSDHPNSYHYYMSEHLFSHIDISPENTFLPYGLAPNLEKECAHYEQLIKTRGPIDLQILGLGENGHIGFNEPHTPFNKRTHIVQLDEMTRQANSKFFKPSEAVPSKAITMGIDTIMDSKEILLLVSGSKKRTALKHTLHGDVTPFVPASILQAHSNVTIISDEASISDTLLES
ncbi:glucosamine-6-phosphate deaminase [Virgibacillus sp. W0430]|uniref:glucosamine-6-phosphate deaminase n=1 Tax=Virgibacillus sp. W0430 TaxID=3391580 RepID=UPI003F458865